VLHRYLGHYERLRGHPECIDEVAHLMGWDAEQRGTDGIEGNGLSKDDRDETHGLGGSGPIEPYTLHRNPVFIATKANLSESATQLGTTGVRCGQSAPVAGALRSDQPLPGRGAGGARCPGARSRRLRHGISLFKRGLEELNRTLALVIGPVPMERPAFSTWRDDAIPRLFDLREIWLRVINECREELGRRVDNET